MGPLFSIEAALQSKLDSIAGKPHIVWENDGTYNPPVGQKYWVPTNLPFKARISTSDRLMYQSGIYQVSVFVPRYKGLSELKQDLDVIYQAYDSDDTLTGDGIKVEIEDIGPGKVTMDKTWCSGFLEINYFCYTRGS